MELGMQMPPHCGQQVVPSMQRIAAQWFSSIGTQIPEQSAPPVAGSQLSLGSSTHTNPSGHGKPASPPHMPPGVEICAKLRRGDLSATIAPASPASTPRRERDLESVFVHRSNRPLSIVPPPRLGARSPPASRPVNAGGTARVPGEIASTSIGGSSQATSLDRLLIYVMLFWPVILPSLSAAASARADIVDARRLGRGEGRRDDSTRLAHLASSWDACQKVGRLIPVWHNSDRTGRCHGSGLLLSIRSISGNCQWSGSGHYPAISAAGAPLPHRPQRRYCIDGLWAIPLQPGTDSPCACP